METAATVQLNGKETSVVSFVNQENRPLALVDLEVLRGIARYLPSVPFQDVKDGLIAKLRLDTTNLEELVVLLEEEVAFHKTVNLISRYTPEVKAER